MMFADALNRRARLARLVGAAGSLALLLRAVARQHTPPSVALIMAVWVVAPYLGLAVADSLARRWSPATRAALSGVTLAIAIVSLVVYLFAVAGPPPAKPAFVWVAVPAASWVLGAIAVAIAAMTSRTTRVDRTGR